MGGQHTVSYFRHLARGNRIRQRRLFESIDASAEEAHPPVLLIHGFFGTRGSMYMLERSLTDSGRAVFSFNLGAFNTRDIRRSAFLIHRKIENILGQTGVARIDIVGHSMGGLIGLYFVKRLGGHDKVRKLVMMGSPYNGTWTALAGVATVGLWSVSTWQLLPKSHLLRELHRGRAPGEVEYYTVAGQRDWVCPPSATFMAEAHNITVPLGHSSLVVSDAIFDQVKWCLDHTRGDTSDLDDGTERHLIPPDDETRRNA